MAEEQIQQNLLRNENVNLRYELNDQKARAEKCRQTAEEQAHCRQMLDKMQTHLQADVQHMKRLMQEAN